MKENSRDHTSLLNEESLHQFEPILGQPRKGKRLAKLRNNRPYWDAKCIEKVHYNISGPNDKVKTSKRESLMADPDLKVYRTPNKNAHSSKY